MGAGNQAPSAGGSTVDAGKRAMLEAMARHRAESQAGQQRQQAQAQSPETGFGTPAGYRPGLAPDYRNAEANSRLRDVAATPNIAAGAPTPSPVTGGISMGPGRSGRYTDEEAQAMVRRAGGQQPGEPRF